MKWAANNGFSAEVNTIVTNILRYTGNVKTISDQLVLHVYQRINIKLNKNKKSSHRFTLDSVTIPYRIGWWGTAGSWEGAWCQWCIGQRTTMATVTYQCGVSCCYRTPPCHAPSLHHHSRGTTRFIASIHRHHNSLQFTPHGTTG